MWPTSESRFLDVDGYRIYVRTFGGRHTDRTLLCVHGGPGGTHDYVLPLSDLTRAGFRVVFYDALGCGRSDLPDDRKRFTLEHDLYVLERVRRSLGSGRIHLMGSSYGGMLALAYASRHSDHLLSLNATGGLCDVPFATREMRRLVRGLPGRTQAVLRKYARRGEFSHPEYEAAVMEFYRRHVCRLWPWPEELVSTMMRTSRPVYGTMNGPNEFTIIGNIKAIDFSDELERISVPTLILHGRYDEVTPAVGERMHERIRGSCFHVLPRSSHVSFWEERAAYMRLVRRFLRDVEAKRRRT
ncbi:MAG TPA: proline iminopeptidase-family hydrolase [Thermoplasmata archaeon]|jgi:proline iminopeptidase|nr:proline iminopeptidase-family hydrolase [Thermoplasmata archaeon]